MKLKFLSIAITVLIVLAFVPAISRQIHEHSISQVSTENVRLPSLSSLPENLSMRTERIISLDNVSNGTHNVPTLHYRDYKEDGNIELRDNSTLLNTPYLYVTSTNDDGVLAGLSITVFALIMLVLIVGLIYLIYKRSNT